MKSDTPLEYAVFQLSPKHSRCELFVSSDGNTEKLASGLVKPFVTHLKVVEQQVALAVQSIKLNVEKRKHVETWFTKGTLERFVRFVSTPEVLELVNTFDVEMSQLEAARRIYSQGEGDQLSGALGGDGTGTMAASDATKKELLRAIDVRLVAVRQDLTTACARASAAGFNSNTVSELQLFADRFGAHRLNEACSNFIAMCQRRSDLINSSWKPAGNEETVRSSFESDMSIDDPTEDHQYKNPALLDQSKPSAFQQPKFRTQQRTPTTTNEKDGGERETEEEEAPTESSPSPAPTQPGQPSRRLSVQDRINLFENKQKESSGGKLVAVKPAELRRLSSDVLSAPAVTEKAVLRRWSCASDMSIDLSSERKENSNIESPLCTPSSASSFSWTTSNNVVSGSAEENNQMVLVSEAASSVKNETRSSVNRIGGGELKNLADLETRASANEEEVGLKEKGNWKEQAGSQSQTRLRTFAGRAEPVGVNDQGVLLEKVKDLSGGGEERNGGIKNQAGSELKLRVFSDKNQVVPRTQRGDAVSRVGDGASEIEFGNRVEDVGGKDQAVEKLWFPSSKKHSRSQSGQFEGGSGVKVREGLYKGSDGNQTQWRSFIEAEVGNEELGSSEMQPIKVEGTAVQEMKFPKTNEEFGSSEKQPIKVEGTAVQEMKFPKTKKSLGSKDEYGSVYGNSKPGFPDKRVSESQESYSTTSPAPAEQVQRGRQSKGNQDLNDELKMKANELEKLFAEHKLRVPGDQSNSARRSKPTDVRMEQGMSSQFRKPAAGEITPIQVPEKITMGEPNGSLSSVEKSYSSSFMKMVDNQYYGDTLRQNFSDLRFSDDSRGKFYEMYMQKRDAKMKEEWGSKGAEKEAKLKAMQDTLERSKAELKAKFSGSSDRQDSVFSARRRAEKLRSFNPRSSMKREQQPVDFNLNDEDDDLSEFPEQNEYGQDRSFSETSFVDAASRSTQTKKLLSNRNSTSSSPRTTAAPVPRSSIKASNPSSGRRRLQSESPLTQSVPNFSDFRKENTKPSPGVSKITTRPQVRNYGHSKSNSEEMSLVKEEKPRWAQSSKKSTANPIEFKDFPPLNSDGVVLAPLKFDKEQIEQSPFDRYSKNVESKPFLRKGNGIGPGAGASIAKLKSSVASETLKNEEEFDEVAYEAEDLVDVAKEEEELESMEVEDCENMDNGKPMVSQGSEKLGNSGSENGDSPRSLSQVDPASVAELPTNLPSTFHAVNSMQDSPGESPVSWNLRMQHSFSYQHETSDVDASVDSPMGSPASWNSHSLTQTEADAARMRKKWGSAQKPFLVANPSNNQSRKDVTKGFKRLLKFGRKNRGTESLADWISATTSEGDDDTEDGRDPGNRSSEDLRKSRMGFSQGHPSEDGFNDSDLFNDQVQPLNSSIPAPPANFKLREDHMSGSSIKAPRSFFSLSSFRSKGSDSKPR